MELKVSAIIVLIMFIINSSFSVFYKNNTRGAVNADNNDFAIFVVNTNKNIEVVKNDEAEEKTEEPKETDTKKTNNTKPKQKKITQPPAQTTPPTENTQPDETQPPTTNEPETPTEPITPPTDEGSDYAPAPSPYNDDDIIGTS